MKSGPQHIFSPRIIITGNSGSGKTYLAQNLSNNSVKVSHLDAYFWEPGGFNKKRPQGVVTMDLQPYRPWMNGLLKVFLVS